MRRLFSKTFDLTFKQLGLLFASLMFLALPAHADEHIRVGIQLEPPSLDPTSTPAASAGEITWCNIYEGLTVVDGEGKLKPRLAKEWQVSEDGRTYTFTLHKGITFHDGSDFNAEVAAFSLQRILDTNSKNPQRQWFEQVNSITVEDDYTLVIHLSKPDSMLPFALSLTASVMVHPDSASTNGQHPIGTGPFTLAKWDKDNSLTLKRNPSYWGESAHLDQATFVFMKTSAGTENALAEGLVDGLLSVTPSGNRFAIRPDYHMITRTRQSKMILAINNARPPFNDLRVRRALSHGLDRKSVSQIYGPQFQPHQIGTHFSPSHPAYVDLVDRYPYNPEEAKSLLAEAGVAPGHIVKISVPPTDYGRDGGLIVADNLEAIGFKVQLELLDWPSWLDQVYSRKDYDLALIMHVEPMDLNIYARDDYYYNYDNAAFKQIWQQVMNARTDEEQNRFLGDAQRQITEDAVNVFLFIRPEQNLMDRRIAGIWTKTPIPSFVLEDIRWTDAK